MTEEHKVNPNTADAAALQTITGIGPAMAERIIAARPFAGLDDLLRVTGISAAFLDKIRNRLVFEPAADIDSPPAPDDAREIETAGDMAAAHSGEPEEEAHEEMEEAQETGEPEEAAYTPDATETTPDPAAEPEPVETTQPREREEISRAPAPAPAPGKTPRYITRGQAFWMSASTAFFAFILAVALTLAVLSALNNGLRFARPDQVRSVQAEVDSLQGQQDTLAADIAGLRTRMDNFEALGGRVTSLEDEVNALSTDLDTVSGELDTLRTDMTGLSETVDELVTQTSRFQAFLEGLTELLLGLSPEDTK